MICTVLGPTITYINAERIVRNLYGMISINVQLIRSYKIYDYKNYITTKADYEIYVGIFKIL